MSTTRPSPPPPSIPPNPLILILGATGTGKSNLAISLATSLTHTHNRPAEIVNCDAMQMYRSLPVITNKVPEHERMGIPHHLIDSIGLDQTPWTVNDYVRQASGIVDGLHRSGRIPILVGGTGYYAHGMLMKDGLVADDDVGDDDDKRKERRGSEILDLEKLSTEEMLERLKELDPEMAGSWHPRDRRKIQRSLEICLRQGRKVSEVYREQVELRISKNEGVDKDTGSGTCTAPKFRYDPLIFWLSASDGPLRDRLNARVDDMVSQGLFDEALDLVRMSHHYSKQGISIDTSKGIWVSIGYKEMEPWATKHLFNPTEYPRTCQLAQSCIGAVKAGTRQYAKRQDRYIRLRLANALRQTNSLDRLFLLDTTDLGNFQTDVITPAEMLLTTFLAGDQLPAAREIGGDLAKHNLDRIEEQGRNQTNRFVRFCEVCDKTLMTQKEWVGHLKSRTHKNCVARKRRLALVEVRNTDDDRVEDSGEVDATV